MQRINLSDSNAVIEIHLVSGVVRIQANTIINGVPADVIQMDKQAGAEQIASAGRDFIKLIRWVKPVRKCG